AIMKRQRTGKHPQLEEAVALWISRTVEASQRITGEIIQGKAKKLLT
ncbi:9419_t:CDS:1, partial [Paraglomus brasilianum]